MSKAAHETALKQSSEEELNRMSAGERRFFRPPYRKATLWRYLETYKFENLLNSGTLYLRQVAKLAEEEQNEGRMNQIQEKALLEYLSNDQTELNNFRAFHEHVRQNSWVTCFSLGEFDEAHMWERFCKHPPNEGVAIRTNYERLASNIDRCSNSRCAMVRYLESGYMPYKTDYLLFQKIPTFSVEREVRVCVLNLEEEHPNDYLQLPVNLASLIQRVYVHPNASEENRQKVYALVLKRLPKNKHLVRWSRYH